MPQWFFQWDDETVDHLAEHGVTPEEFEEVLENPDELTKSRSTGRPMAIGWTSTGKRIHCVYEMLDGMTIYPITAYEAD